MKNIKNIYVYKPFRLPSKYTLTQAVSTASVQGLFDTSAQVINLYTQIYIILKLNKITNFYVYFYFNVFSVLINKWQFIPVFIYEYYIIIKSEQWSKVKNQRALCETKWKCSSSINKAKEKKHQGTGIFILQIC